MPLSKEQREANQKAQEKASKDKKKAKLKAAGYKPYNRYVKVEHVPLMDERLAELNRGGV